MKKRQLNYADTSYLSLGRNVPHQFAQAFALRIYRSNSVYSFIPKNACSTMRLSLAMANGCISREADFNWIHCNNDTFRADLAALIQAEYTFVILRCPFARLASAYLDKIVDTTGVAWELYDAVQRKIEIEDMTFRIFVNTVTKANVLRSNIHWQPQVDFLVYKEYDDYFNLETFATVQNTIANKTQIEIVDARNLTRHGIDRFELVSDGNYADYLPDAIRTMKKTGKAPKPAALYDDELVAKVSKTFKKDIALYKSLFGTKNLMFL
ncbi:MAG: sulfotransferase family 2 domain-containing protein [Methylovulum miyakonense]|uniref:sulfotransferase family 2 domain-containing protein n=1 Tax=Methylovulum miyakonense TaxID=645578 RepID=UPI003BB609EA